MKGRLNINNCLLVSATIFALAATLAARGGQGNLGNPGVMPPQSHPHGMAYGEWSAAWWTWAMELPPVAGHPFIDDPSFSVITGQSGQVWFLAAPFGTVVRDCTIPAGKALFIGLLNSEASDLEGLGNTAAQQAANAKATTDAAVGLFCTIDGIPVQNITSYRFVSPQFTFVAPTPWLFGTTGGVGHSVSDGYFLMLAPLSAGMHTIHFGGAFDFGPGGFYPLDMTYNLTVQ